MDVRVILVGRTGLDAALRLDPGVELTRVRTPYEAVAELATPLDDESPRDSVVVIASDVRAELLAHANSPGVGQPLPSRARLVELVRGLRLVEPKVRVLTVGDGSRAETDLFDGVIREGADAGAVRAALSPRRDAPAAPIVELRPAAEPRREPAPDSATLDRATLDHPASVHAASVHSGAPVAAASGDGVLVDAMLRGRDVLAGAMELIRSRTGDASVEFVATEPGKPGPPGAIAVAWGEVVLGHLVTRRGDAAMADQARWLAGWLRLRDQQTQLRHAAFTDPLTGAWNRRYLDRFLAAALETARGHRWSVTVMVFDIDDFKQYNDNYGHEAGDEILVEAVRMLRSVTRPTDRVCRIGGDEFAVIFHEPKGPRSPDSKHPEDVHLIARRFQQQIVNHNFPKLAGCAPGTLSISGGLATFPWDGHTPAELLAKADERAMQSKRDGKNAITIGPGGTRLGGTPTPDPDPDPR